LRIGIFTECYNPVLNGVVVSIETFRKELEKRGHEYFIFTTGCPGYKDTSNNIIRFSPMIAFKPKGGRYPISWPQIATFQAKKIAQYKLEIIHSQHLLGLGLLGLRVAKKLKIPNLLTYHTLLAEYAHYFPLLPGLAKKYLVKKSRGYCNLYDQLVTPSNSMKKILISYGVTKPIEPIPTGVNISDYENPYTRAEIAEKWGVPQDKKLLLYVSRIAKEKNVDFLFEAIRKLASKRNDFHILLIGGGPELKYYRSMLNQWNIDQIVTFTDMLPKKETNRYFGAADIFVFPSITETQGIVITEAMAAGVSAVAVNKMGPSDIIEDGVDGFLTDLKTDVFTAKIESLLDDENLRKQMAERAKENAKKFSVEATSDQMEKLYEKTRHNYGAQSYS